MIDPDDLRAFMRGFYGYGSYQARYWFIGQEEGGASSVTELTRRVDLWSARGRCEVDDLHAFLQGLKFTKWIDAPPKRQVTWARLVQILLTAEGRPCAKEDMLRYQAEELGRSHGETLIAELMPLPARNLRTWYGNELNLPELRSRREYMTAVRPHRIAHLKEKISEYQPEIVIFYGARRWWPGLLGIEFEHDMSCDYSRLGRTRLLTMKHPAAFGARREDFDEVARAIMRKA